MVIRVLRRQGVRLLDLEGRRLGIRLRRGRPRFRQRIRMRRRRGVEGEDSSLRAGPGRRFAMRFKRKMKARRNDVDSDIILLGQCVLVLIDFRFSLPLALTVCFLFLLSSRQPVLLNNSLTRLYLFSGTVLALVHGYHFSIDTPSPLHAAQSTGVFKPLFVTYSTLITSHVELCRCNDNH